MQLLAIENLRWRCSESEHNDCNNKASFKIGDITFQLWLLHHCNISIRLTVLKAMSISIFLRNVLFAIYLGPFIKLSFLYIIYYVSVCVIYQDNGEKFITLLKALGAYAEGFNTNSVILRASKLWTRLNS